MDWVARRQPAGGITVIFSNRQWMYGGWPRIDQRPALQKLGWVVGQAAFKFLYKEEDGAQTAIGELTPDMIEPVLDAFPTATISGVWVFVDRRDFALIKLGAA